MSEQAVKEILRHSDTVIFVGSGLSLWSGLPTWPELLAELGLFLEMKGQSQQLLRRELERGELLQAASYAFDKLTPLQISEFIREACRLRTAKPHEIHRKVVSLGPTCFITTNYDRLLEDSLRLWRQDSYFRVLTNSQLTEVADIAGARAVKFLFKLHGDVDDVSSLVLTREQYRAFAPDGDKHYALETVRVLQASRPFVYIGFGLRDPDFLYVKDLLSNTYKGGVRDHYAIVADVVDGEAEYWRRNFGMHLLSYRTLVDTHGKRNHNELLHLLDRIRPTSSPDPRKGTAKPVRAKAKAGGSQAEIVLSLARHASRLSRVERPTLLLPLQVTVEAVVGSSADLSLARYQDVPVEEIVDEGPHRLILIGSPGAGKSFAVRQAAARMAERLHDECLKEEFNSRAIEVPLFVDLKLYGGRLIDLATKSLPAGLSLPYLSKKFFVKMFLDAFNEMPREYLENGIWEADFDSFLDKFPSAGLVICSRTKDGLERLDLPIFKLDQIDLEFVEQQLIAKKFRPAEAVREKVLELFQKPFFLRLFLADSINIASIAQPKDVFQALFRKLSADFAERFATKVDLAPVLSSLAYESIERGEEAVHAVTATANLAGWLQSRKLKSPTANEVLNWLIAREILIPLVGGRVAFFHQSVTEFLAATELARIYEQSPQVLRSKLAFRRWDQALFLTLSLLPESAADDFISVVLQADILSAMSAAKFMDQPGQALVISKILLALPDRVASDWELNLDASDILESDFPLSAAHEVALRGLIQSKDMIGGAAAARLLDVTGVSAKSELFQLLLHSCDEYNFCMRIAAGLGPYFQEEDISVVAALASDLQQRPGLETLDRFQGFESAVASLLAKFPPNKVVTHFFDPSKRLDQQNVLLEILCEYLHEDDSSDALAVSGDLIKAKFVPAAFTLYMIGEFSRQTLDWSPFDSVHVRELVTMVKSGKRGEWAALALRTLLRSRPELAAEVKSVARHAKGILKIALLLSMPDVDNSRVFPLFEQLIKHPERLGTEPLYLLKSLEVAWYGHEELFVRLLRLRNLALADSLLFPSSNTTRRMGIVDIGPIHWWLEWLQEVEAATEDDEAFGFLEEISGFFAHCLSPKIKDSLVVEFKNSASKFRSLLARRILNSTYGLSLESFDEEAISFLLADISSCTHPHLVERHLLGSIATEAFVVSKLIPMVESIKDDRRGNLDALLHDIGKNHGRRYVDR